jgi:hypothetical protein
LPPKSAKDAKSLFAEVIGETSTPAKDLTHKVVNDLAESRQEILNNLMVNPGFLSTFGNDFVVQYGPVEVHSEDYSGSRGLGEFTLKVRQEIRIISRDFYNEFEKDNEADLKLHSLRQSLNGDIESV